MTIEEMLERALAAEGMTYSSAADWPAWTDQIRVELVAKPGETWTVEEILAREG